MSHSTLEIDAIVNGDTQEVFLVLSHVVAIECGSEASVVRCCGGLAYTVSNEQAELIKSDLSGGD